MSGIFQMLLGSAKAIATDAYFYLVTLLLPGNGTNGAQNNTFLDSSSNNFTITRNGNTTQGTFSPFSQTGWSNYFDGTGDYLSGIGTTSSFNFMHNSSALWTWECWAYIPSPSTNQFFVDNTNGTTSQVGFYIGIESSKLTLVITRGSTGTWVAYGSSTDNVPANQWVHLAITYDQSLGSNNAKFYINGVASGTVNKTANAPSSSNASNALRIAAFGSGSSPITGYLSNFRIANSIVYSSAFTPATTPLTTSSQGATSVALLTCQSNRFIDNSSNAFAITVNGNTSVQAFSPFAPTTAWSASTNGGSGYFDGTGDYLSAPSNTAFAFGTGNFTVEAWVYITTTQNFGTIFLSSTTGSGDSLHIQISSANKVRVTNASTQFLLATDAVPLNAWTHIAVTRSGTTLTIYQNGVSNGSTTNSTNFIENGALVGLDPVGGTYYFTGYISGLRVLKGTAATITVPTAPPTNITNTSLLLNFTNAGIYDATAKNDLETVGNAQISTTQSKFGGSSMYFDGTGDYLKAPGNQLFAFGAGDFTIEAWVRFASVGSSVIVGNINNSGYGDWAFFYNSAAAVLRMLLNNGAVTLSSSSWTPSANTWYHVAITRSGSTYRFFVDGTQTGSGTDSTSITWTTANSIYVGSTNDGNLQLNGYIQDLRITKGYARYTANFTAPTAAFPLQ